MIGRDKYGINSLLIMDADFTEMTGAKAHDRSKSHMPFIFDGSPTPAKTSYGTPFIVLDGFFDFVYSPAAFSYAANFTIENFTLLMWITPLISATDMLMCQGVTDVDGWEFFITEPGNTLSLRLNQGGSHTDIGAVGCTTPNVWQLVAVTRTGASGQFYVNGVPVNTLLGAGLTNAVSVALGDPLYIGAKAAGNWFNGFIGGGNCGPRIWTRALSSVEIKRIFDAEKYNFSSSW